MHNVLLIKAFEKAGKDIGSTKKVRIARKLSDVIYEDCKQQYGEKILVVNYNKLKKNPDAKIELKSFVTDALSRYLGYANYVAFANENRAVETIAKTGEKHPAFNFLKQNKVAIIVAGMLLIGFAVYYSISKQRWMVWEGNQYIEVKFDAEKYRLGQLKLFNTKRIKYFKKVEVDCNTEFFSPNGEVKVWYGKNSKKELEYFTALGLHPETGKTLNPISMYMIKKHICKTY